jgi:protein TonB
VSSRARLLEGRPPEYPAAARAAAVEAELPLEIVVDASGSVVDARPLQHVGYGLDEAALRAIREYRFVPAQRAGRGVSVRMRWVIDFRLD